MLHNCNTEEIKVSPPSPYFCVADDRVTPGGVRLVTPTTAVNLSREEGHRLLYLGSRIANGDVVLQLRDRMVHVRTFGGDHYIASAWELGRLFRERRGCCLLVKACKVAGRADGTTPGGTALTLSGNATPGPAAMFTSKSPEWYTPQHIIDSVLALFREIDLDPCSNAKGSAANVPALEHFTREDDGLSRAWHGRVYLNPPYGRGIRPWISKVRGEYEAGRVQEAVVLVKSATDTAWFRILSERFARCEVAGRLRFSGCPDPAPFPSTIFYLGDRVQRFAKVFGGFGVIVAPLTAATRAEATA